MGSRLCVAVAVLVVCAFALPAQASWVSQDIGSPAAAGSSTGSPPGPITINGNGDDIWDDSDNFHYAYDDTVMKSGDFAAIVRLDSQSDAGNSWGKAGLMLRADLDADSIHAHVDGTVGEGISAQWRDVKGDDSGHSTPIAGSDGGTPKPYWLYLERKGNDMTMRWAPDDAGSPGDFSSAVTHASPNMPTDAYLGLAVTSHVDGTLSTAVFSGYDPNYPAYVPPPPPPGEWPFGAEQNLIDWTVLNGGAHFRSGDGAGMTPANSGGGFAHDGAHETFLVESPEFKFTGDTIDGTNVLQAIFAGGAGDQNGQGQIYNTPADVLAANGGNSFETGQKGLAFFNVDTGLYDAIIFENDNSGIDTRDFTMADLAGMGVDPTEWYKLQYYENDEGGWGWGQVNSILAAVEYRADIIPEPATLSLLGLGLVAVLRRRRKA